MIKLTFSSFHFIDISYDLLAFLHQAEEVRETTNKVLFERGFVLDASIVKILKNKKSISHNDLLKELF